MSRTYVDVYDVAEQADKEAVRLRTERDAARTALHHVAPWALDLLKAGLVRNERGWSRADGRLALFQEHWMTGSDTVVWRVANGTAFVYGLEESAALAWLATQGGDRG